MALDQKHCVPCRGDVPALAESVAVDLLREIGGGWTIVDGHHLSKEFSFKDFKLALAFVNAVGAIADEEGHHPDVYLTWGKVRLDIWTHAIGGLSESDFILAAKCEKVRVA